MTSAQYSPPWWTSLLTIEVIRYPQSGTIRLTAPSGTNFLDLSGMCRPFMFVVALLGGSLIVYPWMENHLRGSYPSSKHLYALWEAVTTRHLLHLSMTMRSRPCLSNLSNTPFQREMLWLCTSSKLRLAWTTSFKTLFLCHWCKAPNMEDHNVQAYHDTHRMDKTSHLLCYSIAQTFNPNGPYDIACILIFSTTLYLVFSSLVHVARLCHW